jgi:hypothetical protein
MVRPAELKELALGSPFDERNARPQERVEYGSEADRTRAERSSNFGVLLRLPMAPALPILNSGDFGASPLYGQNSEKLVCLLHMGRLSVAFKGRAIGTVVS